MSTTPLEESSFHTELLEQLPILPEATTSRVVVNNPLLRHVLFSMDEGQVLTEHSSSRSVIVNILSGTIEFSIGSEVKALEAGDVVYLAPGDRHAVRAITAGHMSLTLVDTEYSAKEQS